MPTQVAWTPSGGSLVPGHGGRDEMAGQAVEDDLAGTAHVARDDRQTCGSRLEDHRRQCFTPGWQEHYVGCAQQVWNVVAGAKELHV